MDQKLQGLKFGLIGRNIDYSFSRSYFTKKFKDLGLLNTYVNFDCESEREVKSVLRQTDITGYNVTIPYKQIVIPYLDGLSPEAQKIGAVNTICRHKDGKLIGYNTDYAGFKDSLLEIISKNNFSKSIDKALVLGTGGASKAVVYALKSMGVKHQCVSRIPSKNILSYFQLSKAVINSNQLLVNCTPLGTFPKIHQKPDFPYHLLSDQHLLFDLIYNPPVTSFMAMGKHHGALVSNGLRMLEYQAEHAWSIWTTS